MYGDGFQFMRPWLTNDPNEVTSIVSLHHDKILVSFNDNSIVVMELPSLDVVDLLSPSWLQRSGDISVIHVDVPGEKNFAYVGTTDGSVFVLDVMEASIRICDFKITCVELGLAAGLAVSDIQMCPKDDRYLAVGFGGSSATAGAIVIYDLMKSKVHRTFKTSAITCMDWMCSGEGLFAGTMTGELVSAGLDKGAAVEVWNASSERADDADDDGDSESEAAVIIRRVTWLPPQSGSTDGCLFASLGNFGKLMFIRPSSLHSAASRSSDDDLKSILVGLSPLGIHGALTAAAAAFYSRVYCRGARAGVFAAAHPLRAPAGLQGGAHVRQERRAGVPRGDHPWSAAAHGEAARRGGGRQAAQDRALPLRRCLGLGARDRHHPRPAQGLRSAGVALGDHGECAARYQLIYWLTAAGTFQAMAGFLPSGTTTSLSAALLAHTSDSKLGSVSVPAPLSSAVDDAEPAAAAASFSTKSPSRRLSTREFMTANNLISDLELQLGDADRWEMVLASGVHEHSSRRLQDVVVKGHADGCADCRHFGAVCVDSFPGL